MREILDEEKVHPAIRQKIATNRKEIVDEVTGLVTANDVVVVGMTVNPHVKRVRAALKSAGIAYRYVEYGGYLTQWRRRNALKMWTGWPTFPMVFVKGALVGGADEVEALIAAGELG